MLKIYLIGKIKKIIPNPIATNGNNLVFLSLNVSLDKLLFFILFSKYQNEIVHMKAISGSSSMKNYIIRSENISGRFETRRSMNLVIQ